MKKIDMHNHVVKRKGMPRLPGGGTFVTPEELFEMHDEINVSRGVILPLVNVESRYQWQSNEEAMELANMYPDRLSWFCNIDPRAISNSPNTDFSDLLGHYVERGAKGVGEVCSNLYFDDPLVLNFFSHIERFSLPVIFHIAPQVGGYYGLVDDYGLVRLEKVLKMFPGIKFLGHSQCFWSHMSADVGEDNWMEYPSGKVIPGRLEELFTENSNLYGDMSAGSGFNAITRDPEYGCGFLEKFKDRLFFATDICEKSNRNSGFYRFSFWLDDMYNSKKISRDAYEKISYKNALTILEG